MDYEVGHGDNSDNGLNQAPIAHIVCDCDVSNFGQSRLQSIQAVVLLLFQAAWF